MEMSGLPGSVGATIGFMASYGDTHRGPEATDGPWGLGIHIGTRHVACSPREIGESMRRGTLGNGACGGAGHAGGGGAALGCSHGVHYRPQLAEAKLGLWFRAKIGGAWYQP